MGRHKRHRGGQPGNQNARTHGFYTTNLNAPELAEFQNIINNENLDPQLAVIRAKVTSALKVDPGNHRILIEGVHKLSESFNSQHDFTGQAAALVKQYFRRILEAAVNGDEHLIKRIALETQEKAIVLQYQSSLDEK